MSGFEYLVLDENKSILGTFNDFVHALIFIRGYYDTYYNDLIELTIKKQEKDNK